ncbi:MAG: hypothetical protein KAR00_00235 [Candidatus Pacebacteria bacterium]|nr:hypothetical protein [Candidatus Paceibacterota bacterium]
MERMTKSESSRHFLIRFIRLFLWLPLVVREARIQGRRTVYGCFCFAAAESGCIVFTLVFFISAAAAFNSSFPLVAMLSTVFLGAYLYVGLVIRSDLLSKFGTSPF